MGERTTVVLVCSECGARNYRTTKARGSNKKAILLKKFCPTCNRHTAHRESK